MFCVAIMMSKYSPEKHLEISGKNSNTPLGNIYIYVCIYIYIKEKRLRKCTKALNVNVIPTFLGSQKRKQENTDNFSCGAGWKCRKLLNVYYQHCFGMWIHFLYLSLEKNENVLVYIYSAI